MKRSTLHPVRPLLALSLLIAVGLFAVGLWTAQGDRLASALPTCIALLCAWLLVHHRRLKLASHLLVAGWLMAIVGGVLTGANGGMEALGAPVIPLLASVMLHWRVAIGWSGATVGILALTSALTMMRPEPTATLDTHLWVLGATTVATVAVMFGAPAYQRRLDRVRRAHASQRAAARAHAEAAARASDALQSQRLLAAMVSHDLRTPLSGVISVGSLLRQSELDAKQQAQVDLVVGAGEQLLRAVDSLLDAAEADAGTLTLAHEPFDPRDVADHTAALLRPRCIERRIELTVRVDAAVPTHVVGDADRVGRILMNLVGNAIQHASPGPVTIHIEAAEPGLRWGVTDSGPGLPAAVREQLGERWVREGQNAGRGLGLYVVHTLTHAMGGTVTVASRRDGTCFEVHLPTLHAAEIASGDDLRPVAG